MATVRKRGDYQWQAIVKRKGFSPTSKTFLNRKDAEAWATVTESEMLRGVFIPRAEAEKTTLKEALERYRDEATARKKGKSREETRIARWMDHKLAVRSLASIRGADLAKFRDEWRKAGKAENTIRIELALLSHLFEVARREWGMESLQNPVKTIALPGPSERRERRLEPGEETTLLAELEQGRNQYAAPVVRFAIETAMRQGEILGLRWEDVDLKTRVAVLHDTKNGERRVVPLSSAALSVLKSLPRGIRGGLIFKITQDGLIRAFNLARILHEFA
ncbi:MAG: site-specific integrase [Hydrogenophilales bacterium CG_4_9_14_3_um_filter_63_34]|nr:MAG: site-specific integrase [Hydrogenophilales bacterium CG_4_10_14_3_um_filter_63_21]PJB06527.1 MAG: site-specific integrase [Hydrogenophilales bacterium CG_4_9_14_3_um_filter_63_34]